MGRVFKCFLIFCTIASTGLAWPRPQTQNETEGRNNETTLIILAKPTSESEIVNLTITSSSTEKNEVSSEEESTTNPTITIPEEGAEVSNASTTAKTEVLTEDDEKVFRTIEFEEKIASGIETESRDERKLEFEDQAQEAKVPQEPELEDNTNNKNNNNNNGVAHLLNIDQFTSKPGRVDVAASTTSANVFVPSPGFNDPSVQLVPPPFSGQNQNQAQPQEPTTTVSPSNLRDIPLSLVSLSGNSGGTEESNIPDQTNLRYNIPVDFTKFRYHVETGKLLKIGSTGPGVCPPNMRFFAVPGHPKNGACDCDYYQCSRPLIYSLERHQCYWAWSQGPCNDGEWYVFDQDFRKRGTCVKNPCPHEIRNNTDVSHSEALSDRAYLPTPAPAYSSSEYYFLNPQDQKCYQEGTQGYCSDNDERLLIYPGEPIPKCRKFTVCFPLTVPQELQCIIGNKYYFEGGHC